MATRTAEEIFAHHGQALGAGRLDDIVDDFSDDSILIVDDGIDTFVFDNDKIRVQTVKYFVHPG